MRLVVVTDSDRDDGDGAQNPLPDRQDIWEWQKGLINNLYIVCHGIWTNKLNLYKNISVVQLSENVWLWIYLRWDQVGRKENEEKRNKEHFVKLVREDFHWAAKKGKID